MQIVATTSRQISHLEAKFVATSSGYLEQPDITVVILKVWRPISFCGHWAYMYKDKATVRLWDYVVEKETHSRYKIIKPVTYMQSIRLVPAKSTDTNLHLSKHDHLMRGFVLRMFNWSCSECSIHSEGIQWQYPPLMCQGYQSKCNM